MKTFKQIFAEADNKIAGIAAAPGIVIAEVYLFAKEKLQINDSFIDDADEAINNFHEALQKVKERVK